MRSARGDSGSRCDPHRADDHGPVAEQTWARAFSPVHTRWTIPNAAARRSRTHIQTDQEVDHRRCGKGAVGVHGGVFKPVVRPPVEEPLCQGSAVTGRADGSIARVAAATGPRA